MDIGEISCSLTEGRGWGGRGVHEIMYSSMHSSSLRTGRSLTICRSLFSGGGGIGGSKGGAPGTRAPPGGSKFFHFHAVFGKKLKNNSTFGSWRTPLGKILDPPLGGGACFGRGCASWGVGASQGDVCFPGGVYFPEGRDASGGCMLPGGCVLTRGCMLPRGVCASGEWVVVFQHALRQTPPPHEQNHTHE